MRDAANARSTNEEQSSGQSPWACSLGARYKIAYRIRLPLLGAYWLTLAIIAMSMFWVRRPPWLVGVLGFDGFVSLSAPHLVGFSFHLVKLT